MLSITAFAQADFDDWLPLWKGYLTFYEHPQHTALSLKTFERLIDPNGSILGFGARNGDGRMIGIVHYLYHPTTRVDFGVLLP